MPSQSSLSSSCVAAGLVALAFLAASACGSTNTLVVAAPEDGGGGGTTTACDDAKCLPGNKCLPLGDEVKCRKTCSSNTDPATACPFAYTCVKQDPEPFCVKDTTNLSNTSSAKGQFGAS